MQELTIILCCTWKFAITFPLAIYVMKMSFAETLLFTNIGGFLGVIFFTLLSQILINIWDKYWPDRFKIKSRNNKIFTKKSRRFVSIKLKYGLPGIVILTPVILSIPVGAFLITKYYGNRLINYFWLITGLSGWSLVYTFFYMKMVPLVY